MAGVLPGIMLTVLFILVISLKSLVNPEIAPPGPKTSAGEKWKATWDAMPMITVILISIGGIYFGVFTPAEAAGVGAFLISAIALLGGHMKLGDFLPVLVETTQTTAMLFFIIIGAAVFGPFLSLASIPESLASGLAELNLGTWGALTAILITYIILGTFLESLSLVVITIPIVFPIITGLGINPIWFGVLVVIVVEMGLITPPVGLNVFVVKGVAGDEISLAQVFAGVFPFWVAMLVGLVILIAFPSISLFLPSTMFN